jgi:hypothetical protein
MMGVRRTYILTGAEKGAYLTALDKEGRQVWLTRFPAPLPLGGQGVTWELDEAHDKNRVILRWVRSGQRIEFRFDMNTGKVLSREPTLLDPERGNQDVHREAAGDRPNSAHMLRLDPGATPMIGPTISVDMIPAPPHAISPEARFEALEKRVEVLGQKLDALAAPRSPSTDSEAEYQQALNEVKLARDRVKQLTGNPENALDKTAELDAARAAAQLAEEKLRRLKEIVGPRY